MPLSILLIGYAMIKEEHIPDSLLNFAIAHKDWLVDDTRRENYILWDISSKKNINQTYKRSCPLDMKSHKHKTISLMPDPEIVNRAYAKVKSGGRWKPDDCLSLFKGKFHIDISATIIYHTIIIPHPIYANFNFSFQY